MTQYRIYSAVVLLLATGCASGPQHIATQTETPGAESVVLNKPTITKVDYEEAMTPELIQPPTVAEGLALEASTNAPERLPSASGLTLTALEQMAFGSNPAIAQSEARVRALRGKWVQVGLAPNPTAGYSAGEVGNDGKAGQQGGFAGQTFITAHKLQRNRAVVAAEITRAEQELVQIQQRVQTDVRRSYYEALLAQRRVELADQLVRVTSEAVTASKSLLEAEEIPLAGLLQTEVQQQNAIVLSRTAANGLSQAWRQLSAVVGGSDLPFQPLDGDVTLLPETLDWQQQLVRISNESPEMAAAMADVERARRALDRASVEAIPDISTQVSVQYDASTTDTITGVQVGIPLPIWNRNQGGIRQAQAEVTEAVRNVDRVELNLNQRLANAFREYSDAQVTATSYAEELLPRSQKTFDLVQRGFQQGEVGYLDLLVAQQTYSQTNLIYLDALGNLWRSYVRIEGLLLEGSLDAR
ncbi:TolC family protein [Botrimarina mediterranea]|uniref:Cobalt-zinc-cadmium resistance protein CzcC n=1 Tax=Botrimarina mediterranea TaxID=2528022 RepID=A0A518K7H0_9BACT|nr:TolC family protein [Botrimarina mediterranea]QDV73748.1 Cobalt-zinc-cadmium resistance protein CzcC precursor [Botrimarina mediterranea]